MSAFRKWRWSALAVAFAFAASAARAEMITPNSIANPPSSVGSANGTPVSSNNIVGQQYNGLGLDIAGTAITSLNNISVWAPVGHDASISPIMPATISYGASVEGSFVSPGSSIPTTVSSLSLTTFGLNGTPTLQVYGLNGHPLNIVPVLQSGNQIFGFQEWTVAGPGISAFSVVEPNQTGAWGVSGVSFTATAPEPSSLVLAALGALGLAARWRRRRVPAVA